MSRVKDFYPQPNITYTPYMIGSVLMIPNNTPEYTGFTICDGKVLSTTAYSELYALIGNKYGDDGAGTFRVPDYRHVFLRGRDNGGGYDPDISLRTLNPNATGSQVGSIQDEEIQSHRHRYMYDVNSPGAEGWYDLNPPGSNPPTGKSILKQTFPTGGDETRPKNYSVVFIIKII